MVRSTRCLARRLATSAATIASAVVLFAGAPGQVATTENSGELVGVWHDAPVFLDGGGYLFLVLLSEGRFIFTEGRDYVPDCREEESTGSWHLESGELVLEIKKKLEIKGSVGPADSKGYLGEGAETCVYPDEPLHAVEVSPVQERRFAYQIFVDPQFGLLSMKLNGVQYWRAPNSVENFCDFFFMAPRECAP